MASPPPIVRVEFYGVARKRMGVSDTESRGATLGEVLRTLHAHRPEAVAVCTAEGGLQPGFLANINGRTFTSEIETPVTAAKTALAATVAMPSPPRTRRSRACATSNVSLPREPLEPLEPFEPR